MRGKGIMNNIYRKEELTYEDVLIINKCSLLNNEPFIIINKNKILSALGNQYQRYPSKEEAFASVYKSLIINHGFFNGNKRTGVISLYIASLMLNNPLIISDEELCKLTYQIAGENGSNIPVKDIAKKVFKGTSVNETTIKEFNIEDVVIDYVKKHHWLINELAK